MKRQSISGVCSAKGKALAVLVTMPALILSTPAKPQKAFPRILSTPASANPNPGILPPNTHPYGKTYGQWSAIWWQYVYALPIHNPPYTGPIYNPLFDETGAACGTAQSGPVFFLVGVINASGTVVRDECTVPAGKALFFPVLNVEEDNFVLPPTNLTVDELRAIAAQIVESATDLHAIIDGVPVQEIKSYRTISPEFSYNVPNDDNIPQFFGTNVTGNSGPAVGDGYYLMLAPLPLGRHTLNFGGTFSCCDFSLEVTYHLTVTP
jgi:hypothetical protein